MNTIDKLALDMTNTIASVWMRTQKWALDQAQLTTLLAGVEQSDLRGVSYDAVEAKAAAKASINMSLRGNIAVINIRGVITRNYNFMTWFFGGVAIEHLAKELTIAANHASVKTIVLNINSPGGTVSGLHEFAEMVYSTRRTGKKRIVSYVGATACSAAYWIASAANEIVIDATAELGSIGVVATGSVRKNSNTLEIVSSQSPNKRLSPTSEAGKKAMQTSVDQLADIFISKVALYRGVSKSTVTSKFGKGGVKMGKAAVKCGLANRLGSFEGVIKAEQQR